MTEFVARCAGTALDAQPAAEVHEGTSVLWRGYIANRAELLEEAKRRGETVAEAAAGRLFALAYRWWGEELQARVTGEYALAAFDQRTGSLLLTHDALGLVPLFYAETAAGIAFASHLTPLVRLTGVQRLDEEYLAEYLATCSVPGARTPYTNIRRLLPGESLRWAHARVSVRKTWDLGSVREVRLASDAEYEERLRTLLREGVTAALQSDGSVWGELSGGLDSSSVMAVAGQAGAEIEALSIVYSASRSGDESRWMKAVVRQYGLPWHTIDADEAKPFSELPDSFCAEPMHALPAAGLFRRYRALAEAHGVRVILTGYGGDQVFCGDSPKPYYLADYLPFQPRRLRAGLRLWQAKDPDRRSWLHHLARNVLRPAAWYWSSRSFSGAAVTGMPAWIHPDYRRRMRLELRSRRQPAPRCRSVGRQYQAERIWRAGFSAGDGAGQSFELRYPLLYRPLVELMLGIPWEQKLRPGQDRYLQRRALAGVLPEPVRQRRDKAGPEEAQFEGLRRGSPWTDLLLTRPRVVERGYVDARRWHEAVHQARFGRIASMRHFIATATLEVWLRQWEDLRKQAEAFPPEGSGNLIATKGEIVYASS